MERAMTAIDKALGISPQVLALRAQRMNLLSSNIANADTPGYKARDIDFAAAMRQAEVSQGRFERTHSAHIALSGSVEQPDALYRVPAEVSPDGNSVDPTMEEKWIDKDTYFCFKPTRHGRISFFCDMPSSILLE